MAFSKEYSLTVLKYIILKKRRARTEAFTNVAIKIRDDNQRFAIFRKAEIRI